MKKFMALICTAFMACILVFAACGEEENPVVTNTKLTEDEWTAAVDATLAAENFTLALKMQQTYNGSSDESIYTYAFDGDKVCVTFDKAVSDGSRSTQTLYYGWDSSDNILYEYSLDAESWSRTATTYEGVQGVKNNLFKKAQINILTQGYINSVEVTGYMIRDFYSYFGYDGATDTYTSADIDIGAASKNDEGYYYTLSFTVTFGDAKVKTVGCNMQNDSLSASYETTLTYGTASVTLPAVG